MSQDGPRREAFDCLENAVDWAEGEGLGVILDLHILRGHCFGQMTEPKLFTDPEEEGHFSGMWRQLSSRLASRSTDLSSPTSS